MRGTCRALGEIDWATASAFGADLHDVIDSADEAFVSVDCSRVTFMDSAGYHALVDATNYAVRRGHTLVIRDPSPSCARLLRLCDMNRELRIDALIAAQAAAACVWGTNRVSVLRDRTCSMSRP
jgi:anti-anti-sigma factor